MQSTNYRNYIGVLQITESLFLSTKALFEHGNFCFCSIPVRRSAEYVVEAAAALEKVSG